MEDLNVSLFGDGDVDGAEKVAPEMVYFEPDKESEATSFRNIPEIFAEQIAQLQVGDWFGLLIEGEQYEHLKLVWIGEAPSLYVFVNKYGQKVKELNKEELAELMHIGAANKIESLDVPFMDRATNMMLQQMHEKMLYNSSHDAITGILNKKGFEIKLRQDKFKLFGDQHIFCYIEILDYEIIINACGFSGIDALLRQITQLIKKQLNDEFLFVKLGDKTLGILFKNCSSEQGYEQAEKIRALINQWRFKWNDKSYPAVIGMGLISLSECDYDPDELLNRANLTFASGKQSGRDDILFYQHEDENFKNQNEIYSWVGRIDHVLSEDRLFLRCQRIAPIYENKEHEHYEILLGITDENGNIIPPIHFIPAAERYKRMPEVDRWVVTSFFEWFSANRSQAESIGGFAINLSGQSINNQGFLDFLSDILASGKVNPEQIIFEITETVAAENLTFTSKFINQITRFGCKFSLDDFGSGYSSYSYIRNLRVNYLKIDGAFVKDIDRNERDIAIVKSMNEIAHSLGMETVAEYVENKEILEIIKTIGVDYAQGWEIHKPILLKDLIL